MERIDKFLTNLYQDETKSEKPSTRSVNPQKLTLLKLSLKKLASYGLLNDPGCAEDWVYALADLSEAEIINGTSKSIDHKGYLTLGEFRGMCKLDLPHASHRIFKALPHKAMEPEEMKKRMDKLRQETGL